MEAITTSDLASRKRLHQHFQLQFLSSCVYIDFEMPFRLSAFLSRSIFFFQGSLWDRYLIVTLVLRKMNFSIFLFPLFFFCVVYSQSSSGDNFSNGWVKHFYWPFWKNTAARCSRWVATFSVSYRIWVASTRKWRRPLKVDRPSYPTNTISRSVAYPNRVVSLCIFELPWLPAVIYGPAFWR